MAHTKMVTAKGRDGVERKVELLLCPGCKRPGFVIYRPRSADPRERSHMQCISCGEVVCGAPTGESCTPNGARCASPRLVPDGSGLIITRPGSLIA